MLSDECIRRAMHDTAQQTQDDQSAQQPAPIRLVPAGTPLPTRTPGQSLGEVPA